MASPLQHAGVVDPSVAESGFADFIRTLGKTVDGIAAEETDEDVLSPLCELSEVLRKMIAAPATAEVLLHPRYEIWRGEYEIDIDEAVYMITRAAATGNIDWELRVARRAIEATEEFTRTRQLTEVEIAAMMETANETVYATGETEEEEAVNDREVFLDDQVQQEMREEMVHNEMVSSIDEALEELRLEAAGCIPDPPRTGYLGRYGFISVQDLFR
jgi:hypothetical protein